MIIDATDLDPRSAYKLLIGSIPSACDPLGEHAFCAFAPVD